MEQYGLLAGGRKNFSVTSLGESLVHPDSEHPVEKSLKQSFLRVSLWSKIYAEHKKDPPPVGGFWSVIRKFTNIDPEEAKKVEKKVRASYIKDVSHVSNEVEIEDEPNNDDSPESSGSKGDENPKIPVNNNSEDRDMSEFTRLDLATSIIYLRKGNEKEEYKRVRRMLDADYSINDQNAGSPEEK